MLSSGGVFEQETIETTNSNEQNPIMTFIFQTPIVNFDTWEASKSLCPFILADLSYNW
jgi:hypothetical protein